MEKKPLLEVSNLQTFYPVYGGMFSTVKAHVHAVDGVSFRVWPHETLGIVGESGCGKSTLIHTIMCLEQATGGSVSFDGKTVFDKSGKKGTSKADMQEIRRNMQIVFQDPYSSLDPRITVGQIIEEPFKIHRLYSQEDRKEEVWKLLDMVGLEREYYDRYPHEFSGGQRQRICIARALALKPKLILCDEPVSALDVSIQSQILNLLKKLQNTYGLTYIFISHALNVVRYVSDRVGVMYLGKIVELAPSDRLYKNPRHPYTEALLSAIPTPDPTVKKERIILQGELPDPKNPPLGCRFCNRCPYAKDICREREPLLREIEPDYYVACHFRNC